MISNKFKTKENQAKEKIIRTNQRLLAKKRIKWITRKQSRMQIKLLQAQRMNKKIH